MSCKFQYVRGAGAWLLTRFTAGPRAFCCDGQSYAYFDHRYNFTAFNERRVEIPLARHVLQSCAGIGAVLEVGNVLSHYGTVQHAVVDKYEKSTYPRLLRADAETVATGTRYDLIVSISTFEHIGWDEEPRDDTKLARTIAHLRRLLKPQGVLFFTVPLGYNAVFDRVLAAGQLPAGKMLFLQRVSWANTWQAAPYAAVRAAKFNAPYPFANALALGWLGPLT
jgi:SAM-dependent methyltransferase